MVPSTLKLLIIGITFLACLGCTLHGESVKTQDEPLQVATLVLEAEPGFRLERQFSGEIEARRHSSLSFEVPGQISRVLVDEGDTVVAGTILAELDTQRLQAVRSELLAKKLQQVALAELATATAGRVGQAAKKNAVSVQTLDEAERRAQAEQASIQAIDAAVTRIDVDLDKSVLRAPYTGTVIARHLDEGEIVQPARPCLDIEETGHLELRVGLPSEIADQSLDQVLTQGDFEVRVDGRMVSATLQTLVPRRELQTRTLTAKFNLTQVSAAIRPGDLAQVTIRQDVANPGFWLPKSALTEGVRGLWSCFVVIQDEGQSKVERRQVEVVSAQADQVFVQGVLRPGERVVATGVHRLVPGQRVSARSATEVGS